MRLVQVAKALGMTGQELRHELSQVDFGVKPSDREVSDKLAQGIVRFLARKYGKEVDLEALGIGELSEPAAEAAPPLQAAETPAEQAAPPKAPPSVPAAGGTVPVLRKLTLEGVSPEAVAKQRKELARRPTKAEAEEQQREERLMAGRLKKGEAAQAPQRQIKKKEGVVLLPAHVSVKEFAEKTGVQIPLVIQALLKNGVLATINQMIDYDTAAIVAAELSVEVQKEAGKATAENLLSRNIEELLRDEPEHLVPRPPVVVVMGHVDHGKTSILDAIRQTDVVAKEAGGITQHIGAYQIEHQPAGTAERRKVTFLDTPGHEAFTAMRARGAQVTDIAVIVVAADEGVKPTTVEAIDHAKDAEVPILVAINKIDKPAADPEKAKGELAAHGLQPEEWGGAVPFVLCSALTKQGIPELLDSILLQADLAELTANPNRPAVATVIESHLDPSLGPLATVIVNTGTLRAGDSFVCGSVSGKVRTMIDARGGRLEDVSPSGAVRVSGFDDVPHVGDILQVVASEQEARALLEAMRGRGELEQKRSFADLVSRLTEGKITQLKVVLKADAQGSLEALQQSLGKLSTPEVSAKVIHAAVGAVTESDVMMAAASDGVVFAFHVPVSVGVRKTAEREGVQIREYEIIYQLLDDVVALLQGLVEPEEEEKILGHVEIRGVFLTKKKEQIIGGRVTDGTVKRLPFRLMRGGQLAGTGRITSLKHVDKDIKEAKEGSECGMRIESSIPIAEGDVLDVYMKQLTTTG